MTDHCYLLVHDTIYLAEIYRRFGGTYVLFIFLDFCAILVKLYTLSGDRSSTVVKVLCYKSEGRWYDPSWCQWIFFIDIKYFRSHYGPGVDSASNRNEYHEYFLGGKGGRCVRLTTYHHPVPLSRNLGTLTSWNPLGLSRPIMGLLYLFTQMGRKEWWFIRDCLTLGLIC